MIAQAAHANATTKKQILFIIITNYKKRNCSNKSVHTKDMPTPSPFADHDHVRAKALSGQRE